MDNKNKIKTSINANELFKNILKININSFIDEKIERYKNNDNKEFFQSVVDMQKFFTRDYCPYCENNTTLVHTMVWSNTHQISNSQIGIYVYSIFGNLNNNFMDNFFKQKNDEIVIHYNAMCTYKKNHKIEYSITINNEGKIFKFAEYPFSLILRKIPNPNEKLLKQMNLNKFMHNAYLSAQNNLWLGAFLYIRRVLEGLIHHIAKEYDINIIDGITVGKKLELIKNYLPEYVKNNIKKLSTFLGSSIHNRNDNESKIYYDKILKLINIFIHEIESNKKREKDKKELELIFPEK